MNSIPAPLRGKVAVMTGGSRGIGAAIATMFAAHGCSHIAITYNSNKKLADGVLAQIAGINGKVKTRAFAIDVGDPTAGRTVIEQSLQGLGVDHLDIVVCGAAYAYIRDFPPVDELTIEFFNKVMTGNAFTPFLLTREAAKVMPPGGRIIHLSSGASKVPLPDRMLSYAVSKAAMEAVSKNMAADFGIRGNGITVNSVSIGSVWTDALRDGGKYLGPGWEKKIEDLTITKRIGQPEDIASIVAFIASPQSRYISGNLIPANGGALAMLQG